MLLFPVDLEAGVARLEEIHNLACGGKTCIHVGLGRLGAHFLRGCEYAGAELLLERLVIAWRHIRDVLQIRPFLESLLKPGFVDDLLAGGVDQAAPLRHLRDQVVAYRTDGLRSGRNMHRDEIAG